MSAGLGFACQRPTHCGVVHCGAIGPSPMDDDFTYVATWKGFVHVASAIDAYARRIVGWRVSTSAHAGFVLDALEQAVHDRRPGKGVVLVHHSDSRKMVASSWAA